MTATRSPSPTRATPDGDQEFLQALHLEYAATHDPVLETELVVAYTPLAFHLAKRQLGGSDDQADARQVALYGLVQALRRWDPERGVAFSTFAWSTISGELKRFRRDTGWGMRVSRSVQEAHLHAAIAVEELGHELGRAPTVAEIAERMECSTEEVIVALHARQARSVRSLDAASPSQEERGIDIGEVDSRFDDLDEGAVVGALLARLGSRDRELIRLRFVEELTQTQIANRLGMSQIHVSRQLARLLQRLRSAAAIA